MVLSPSEQVLYTSEFWGAQMVSINAVTGEEIWTTPIDGFYTGSPAISPDGTVLYYVGYDGQLVYQRLMWSLY